MSSVEQIRLDSTSATVEQFGTFDFGLTAEQERRAASLHQTSLVIDLIAEGPCGNRAFDAEMVSTLQQSWNAHPDPWRLMVEAEQLPARLCRKGRLPAYRDWWEQSGVTAVNRSVSLNEFSPAVWAPILAQFDAFPWLVKALVADDFLRAREQGLRAAFVNTQIPDGVVSVRDLEVAHELGLRMMQLTYNTMNHLAGGCLERTDAGVSRLGAEFIAAMNRLGVIVDISHSGHATTLDACAISEKPVVASHTAARTLSDHPRCKSDDELRAIAATGGVVGVVTVPHFLRYPVDGIEDMNLMLDHIDYIASALGTQHVSIGTDWPMGLPNWFVSEIMPIWEASVGFPPVDLTQNTVGFDDFRDWPNITRGLVARGYNDEQVRDILGRNFLRVFRAVCG